VEAVRGGTAELRGDEARHLTRVLRVEPGQRYEISDNHGVWLAEIVEARGERVVFRVGEAVETAPLPLHITLCAALVKFDRFEWIVEKATELGVEIILPVEAERTEKGLMAASRKRAERWQRIAREASQQSRRVSIPEILPAIDFAGGLRVEAQWRYFLDEDATPALLSVLPEIRSRDDRVALMLGPEGGWTAEERSLAIAAGWQLASLGPTVLRAETAATAAMAVITSAWLKPGPAGSTMEAG
jgi:16S rRNA (uracil1498-N3)-methyltransferase